MADVKASEWARRIVGDYVISVCGRPSLEMYDKLKGDELVLSIDAALDAAKREGMEEAAKVADEDRADYDKESEFFRSEGERGFWREASAASSACEAVAAAIRSRSREITSQ